MIITMILVIMMIMISHSYLGDGFLEELLEEGELRDVLAREASEHVEQQLQFIGVLPA